MSKPKLVLDFDGVIHNNLGCRYNQFGPPIPDAFKYIRKYIQHFDVYIYSSRSHHWRGIQDMKNWFLDYGWPGTRTGGPQHLTFPDHKPIGTIGLDDRVITFRGRFPQVKDLKAFKQWQTQ